MQTSEFQDLDQKLEALFAFLESERSPPESMLPSDLDGFLTAIAIGPEPIMPSEWLPVVWGGEEPVFDDPAEMQTMIGAMLGRYDEILRDVEDGSFEPILLMTPDGMLVGSDWAIGFIEGMGLRLNAWQRLLDSRRGSTIMVPILALCADEYGDAPPGLDGAVDAEVMATAAEALPAAVISIAAYWRARRPAAPARPKTGRNEPCPCGSGKKFKRCCGA